MMEIDVNQELRIKFEAGSIKGEDGITPHIGDNGNWYVGGTDTGVQATGERGEPGQPGYTPVKGKDYFDGQPGKDGRDGVDGAPGRDGEKGDTGATGPQGPTGPKGDQGEPGPAGEKGEKGDKGDPGEKGDAGSPGADGKDGKDGTDGQPGKSAYQIAVEQGFKGTEKEWLESLHGKDAEGGTVEVDPTLSIEGMAADAKAVGDAINAIGSGGAQVQPDWNQHDSTAPDYVKNRVAYPAYSPVLLCETSDGTSGDACVYGIDGLKAYPAPAEGKQYTFGIAGGKVYTGVASSGEYDDDGEMLPGIMIADENNNALVFYINLYGISGWYAKIPDFDFDNVNYTELALVVVEGDNACNKLSVPDDVLLSGEDMNIVFEFKSMREYPPDYIRALLNDVEVVVDENGVETVYTKDDLLILGEADHITNGVMYALGEKTIAMIAPMGESGETIVLVLVDEQAATGSGTTVKSFKVNIPGIFAPNIPAKKLPAECMPDGFEGSVTYYVNVLNPEDMHLYSDKAFTTPVTMMEFFNALNGSISVAGVMEGMVLMRVAPLICSIPGEYGAVTVAVDITDGVATYNTWYTAEYTG